MKVPYESKDPLWLRGLVDSFSKDLYRDLEDKRQNPSLFGSYNPEDKMILFSCNDILDQVYRNTLTGFEWTRPENFVKAMEHIVEGYQETYHNPFCRYEIETGVRRVIVNAEINQPELLNNLNQKLKELEEIPDHPTLLRSALANTEGVSHTLTSDEHANLAYVIGLTTRDYQNLFENVKEFRDTSYADMIDKERLKTCAELSREGAYRFSGEEFKKIDDLVSTLELFSNNPHSLKEIEQNKKRGYRLVDTLRQVSAACFGLCH